MVQVLRKSYVGNQNSIGVLIVGVTNRCPHDRLICRGIIGGSIYVIATETLVLQEFEMVGRGIEV